MLGLSFVHPEDRARVPPSNIRPSCQKAKIFLHRFLVCGSSDFAGGRYLLLEEIRVNSLDDIAVDQRQDVRRTRVDKTSPCKKFNLDLTPNLEVSRSH